MPESVLCRDVGKPERSTKLSLEEALRRWSDPEDVAGLDELKGYAATPDGRPTLEPVNDKYFEMHWELCRRRKPLEAHIRARLRAGELIASGIFKPINVSSPRQLVDPELWDLLKPDFLKSEAKGSGLHIIHIEVEEAGQTLPIRGAMARPEPEVEEFTHSPDFSWVKIREHEFLLDGGQRDIVKMLFEARHTSNGWVRGKRLTEKAGYSSMNVGDAFKRQKNWRELIEGTRRGYYRLNLKGSPAPS